MLTPTHEGVEILLAGPSQRARQAVWRRLGLGLAGLPSLGVAWVALTGGPVVSAGLLALPLVLFGLGVAAYTRDRSEVLLITQHYVRIVRTGASEVSVPLHQVHGASIYDEQLVLHTDAGDEHFWMLGRDLDEAAEVALLIEEQLDRFKAAHGTEDVPEALRRMVGEREL
ncbi:MAG: hypothetical protein R3F61_00055 [Myxococcota bacterium]